MPAITLDVNVVDGSNTKIHTNPVYQISTPVNVPAESIGIINSPFDISPILHGQVGAPVVVTSLSAVNLLAPIDIVELTPAAVAVPNSINANALDPETPPFALNHARVLYNSALLGSSVSVSTGANGSYTLIPNTAQRYNFSNAATITYTLPAGNNIDTVCVGAHNLSGYTITASYSTTTSSAFTAFASSKTPSNDNAIMFHVGTAVTARRVRIVCTGTGTSKFIGSVYAGIAMQMQRPFFGGHTPTVLARKADYFGSMSESGNFIGAEVRRRSIESEASWKNLTDTWYRTYFIPFLTSAETLPFYFAWNLSQYPNDVAYCMNITNIEPVYSGQLDLMTVGIPLVGIA